MENNNNSPDTQYNDQSQPLDQIIKSSSLPTIIKYDANQEMDPYLVGPSFDSRQALLLHSKHEVQRVCARSANFRPESKSFEDTGLDVTVDEQCTGWFAVFGNPTDHYSDPVVPHFRNIGKLAISPCHQFLISGKKPLDAMKIIRHGNKKSLEPFHIYPGTVLTKRGMYTVSLKIKIRKSMFNKKVINKDEMYMACHDELNNEMLIHCQTSGIFYVLTQISTQMKTPVLKMADIINRYRFPLLVKLIHGYTAQMPSACKGTFILLKSDQTKMSFASTLLSQQPDYFEMASDASIRFFTAIKTPDFGNDDAYSGVFGKCSDRVRLLFQSIRFRPNDIGLTSARSSATSGHGSGLSDEEERFDWSKVNLCSNTPFVEAVDSSGEPCALFTHHNNDSKTVTPLQTHLTQRKDKKTKVQTKAIKRTTMYDSPTSIKSDVIPIAVNCQSSLDSINASTPTTNGQCGRRESSSTSSSPPTSPAGEGDCRNEYGELWNDTSSEISGESLEVVVENVTLATDAAVQLRNSDTESASTLMNGDEQDENPYDILYFHQNRNSRHNYFTMGQILPCADLAASQLSPVYNDGNGVYQFHIDDSQTLQRSDTGTYEESGYEIPINRRHERQSIPQPYEMPATSQNTYEEPIQDSDVNHYERVDDLYRYASDATYVRPENRQGGNKPGLYCNTPHSSEPSDESPYVMPSSYARDFNSHPLPKHRKNTDSGVYVNIPSLDEASCSNELGKLISNMKSLGLKPATEEAIKSIDLKMLESKLGDMDFKSQLNELFPSMNKIDLNKISLFLDGTHKW